MTRTLMAVALVALAASPSGASVTGAGQTMDDIAEAVVRQQLETWAGKGPSSHRVVVCLAAEQAGRTVSVTPQFLQRFKADPYVRSAAECEVTPTGSVERATRRPAVILTLGPMEWVAGDEVRVKLRHYRTRLVSGTRTYRVVRERSRWICLGPVILLSPA